jgi:transcriptional regulator with XRE-family HTH domain
LHPREVRAALGLTQKLFARAAGISERTLAELERDGRPRAPQQQRLVELDRLRRGLARVMRPEFIGTWLVAPNPAFGGLKPLEVIERGELDRLWRMIFQLESGMPG